MIKQKFSTISGTLFFENKKILLKTNEETFFVQKKFLDKNFIHGDSVLGRITLVKTNGRMAEVGHIKLLERSKKILLGYKIGKYIFPISGIGTLEKIKISENSPPVDENILVEFIFEKNFAKILKIFSDPRGENEISSILFLNDISTTWSEEIKKQEKFLQQNNFIGEISEEKIPENNLLSKLHDIAIFHKNDEDFPFATIKNDETIKRIDLRNWFTLTIDGADAKDLDDAISIARYENGDFLLGVHIADVSYYIKENSPIDHEAKNRWTSIYIPNEVIPMLPETLSNNLCSLLPQTAKKTLTCLMKISKITGKVLHTDVFASIIESKHRWIYDEIYKNFLENSWENQLLESSIQNAFELFKILEKRRKNEGKISFETTELFFDISEKNVKNVKKRERNDAHRLIEEFMVTANEEVAKWCRKRKIPFLSRIHDAPSDEAEKIISEIIGFKPQKNNTILTPKHIQNFLDKQDEATVFFASRLILPKMSKAFYSANKHGHFGLALDEYSHFTSPIRRYPDLITHRMIHAYLEKNLKNLDGKKIFRNLEKIAELSSQNEKKAENIERAITSIYTLRYMKNFIGKIFSAKISSLSEFAIFLELETGIEVTVYLEKYQKYRVDHILWCIFDKNNKKIFTIGEGKNIKITEIKDGRILAKIENPQ